MAGWSRSQDQMREVLHADSCRYRCRQKVVKNVPQPGQLLAARMEAQHQSKTPFPENSFSASVIPQSCKLCFSSLLRHEGFDTLDLRENSSIGRRASARIDPKLALTLPSVSDSFLEGCDGSTIAGQVHRPHRLPS